jgi:ERCC4-related helicase
MILDNNKDSENLKVHEWITKYTESGELDIVTGYFTIGALAFISDTINNDVTRYRMVLGDIVKTGLESDRPLDLLNENISLTSAFQLKGIAKKAVEFLKQDKVLAKTLEPNFCHAKLYLYNPSDGDDRKNYFISGSSNLTDAGIGRKINQNLELNVAESGDNYQYKDLASWFDSLWENPKAHKDKTILEGKKESKIDFKKFLIGEIEKLFVKYDPRDIYFKMLFELFGQEMIAGQDDPDFARKLGRLENSVIYKTLYPFQQSGVLSLIKMLQKYNGAILADAVGLGKTWSALAVMKYFQQQGHEVVLLCPKKLEHNWRRYLRKQESRFEEDKLDYEVRFHTDLFETRLEKYTDRSDHYFTNDKPKLFVIDESHNLRNDKSSRYKFLMENILQKNEDIKVLLLSATPINNNLNDIRNQFKLMVKGQPNGFYEKLDVRNLDFVFRSANRAFNAWRNEPNPRLSDLIGDLPDDFVKLTDPLIVSRTRKMIEGQETGLTFPTKNKPINLFVTPSQLGNFESFEELFEHFPPKLSGYQPSFYTADDEPTEPKKDVLQDEKQREHFLVKMLYILMVKRLESSWFSFFSTVGKIRDHHQNALDRIKLYEKTKENSILNSEENDLDDDEITDELEQFTLGKKRKILLSEIDEAGKIDQYKKDLKEDIAALDNLYANLEKFEKKVEIELGIPRNHSSADDKLEVLIKQIVDKRARKANNGNQKIIIFTVYKDTAEYLFTQLKNRGFDKLAMVSGTGAKVSDTEEETAKFEPILERFAPYTKLYKEKKWDAYSGADDYTEWVKWAKTHATNVYDKIQRPIDILIATDALSEGQNLQDGDLVINYDIHWNPVRIIQRMGRIDRLGSPNDEIFGINFWPSNNVNTYLNLQDRIEQRMAAMKLAGSEVDSQFSESFGQMVDEDSLDTRLKDKMLRQMETTFDDLDGDESFGFDDLSLERYRQDLFEEFEMHKQKYQQMPKGVYSGFVAQENVPRQQSIVSLMGYPSQPTKTPGYRYKTYELIYTDTEGKSLLLNQKEVLEMLRIHKNEERYVPEAIDQGEPAAVDKLAKALAAWLQDKAVEVTENEDGTTEKKAGAATKDLLAKLAVGNKSATTQIKEGKITDRYTPENYDLLAWMLVSDKN